MRFLDRWLLKARFLTMILAAGAVGGLLAPVSSHAGTPTLTIDGINVTLEHDPNCTDSFTNGAVKGCYRLSGAAQNVTTDGSITNSIPRSGGLLVGSWYVGSVSATNKARVLINDVTPGTENMKLTGVTFTSATNAFYTSNTIPSGTCANNSTVCDSMVIVLKNVFDAQDSSGSTLYPYRWLMSVGGHFDPPADATGTTGDENVIGNNFRLAGQACFTYPSATGCTPPAISSSNTGNNLGTIGYCCIGSPTTLNYNGPVTRQNPIIFVDIDGDGIRHNPTTAPNEDLCNTGNSRCRPTLLYQYEVQIYGKDTLVLTDSVAGCGGVCTYDPNNKKVLQCDGPASTDPKVPDPMKVQCEIQTNAGLLADKAGAKNPDGSDPEEAQTCDGTCIIILVEGTPPGSAANKGPFKFTAVGPNVASSFDITLGAQANGAKVFSSLVPTTPPNGERCFTIDDFPPGGAKGDFQLDQVQFRSDLGSTGYIVYDPNAKTNNSSTKIGACVTKLDEGDHLYINMHVH